MMKKILLVATLIVLSFMIQNESQFQQGQLKVDAESIQQETEYKDMYVSEKKIQKLMGDVWEKESEIEFVTELFVIESETGDGYLNARSIDEDTNAPFGYILDNKYKIGDVVSVSFSNDDILSERNVTDKYVQAEDGSYLPLRYYELLKNEQDSEKNNQPKIKMTGEKKMKNKMVYVNAYSVTRHYGGDEEGGWWYNWYECIETVPCKEKYSEQIAETIREEHDGLKHGNIYSVNGGVDLLVMVEEKRCQSETTSRPYYE